MDSEFTIPSFPSVLLPLRWLQGLLTKSVHFLEQKGLYLVNINIVFLGINQIGKVGRKISKQCEVVK